MGLARPAVADEHHRLGPLDVAALGQRLDLGGEICGRLAKSNSSSVLTRGRWASLSRRAMACRSRSSSSACEQRVQVAEVAVVLALGLLGEARALPGDGRAGASCLQCCWMTLSASVAAVGLGRCRAHRAAPGAA